MKYAITWIILTCVVSMPALADVQPMHCVAFDERGTQIGDTFSFYASRGSKDFSLSNEESLEIDFSWPYYESPLRVSLIRNPYYPWNVPFTEKTLSEEELNPNSDGNISGTVHLQNGSEEFTVECSYAP